MFGDVRFRDYTKSKRCPQGYTVWKYNMTSLGVKPGPCGSPQRSILRRKCDAAPNKARDPAWDYTTKTTKVS